MRRRMLLLGLLACLGFAGCKRTQTYNSIWQDVYGMIPPYQEKLEALELEKE